MIVSQAMPKLVLFDFNVQLTNELEKAFSKIDTDNIQIITTTFEDLPECDCLVQPSNSYGLTDNGMSDIYSNYFGPLPQYYIQERILMQYAGEQPVGSSIISPTKDPKFPLLCHLPIMKYATDISKTDNIYQAMKAMLLSTYCKGHIKSICCPNLGTGTGLIHPKTSAKQMALAYETVFINPIREINLINITNLQNRIAETLIL